MTLVGTKILHYRIVQEIGAGGMGIVYLAEDEKLHRRVALKFLAKSIQDDPDARERLIREARAASALNHPNIVAIHSIETTPEHVFIVMEYVEGESIHRLIKDGKMTWPRAVELAPQVLSALATAHDAGIVHRDIKSDNILLTPKGQIKVLDFGLARGRDPSVFTTRAGSSAGTPAYMSPEQVQGEEMTERSDLFSFGVVLYEMLTGRLPFKGEHEAALTYSIVNETPSAIHTHNKSVPRGLENIVTKLLEKDPKARYQSAQAVLDDLSRLRAGEKVKAHPRRRRLALAVIAGVLIPALALLLARERAPRTSTVAAGDASRKMVAVLPFENLGPTDQEYFADGITEEITTHLAKMSGLGVISRTSAMQYKGSNKSLREIGKELGVDYALEGSVRWDKSGTQNNVRISVQLIRINDDTHLWADNFDRVYDQIFSLQSEIAQKVADELNVTLLEPEREALAARPTQNLDAYDVYLRGREKYEGATSLADIDAALALIEQAVALDSTFARAQAFLARNYANQYFNGLNTDRPRLKQARAAALAAMRHSAHQPSGHIAMGYYYYYASRDYTRALEEFAIAEKMQPNNAEVLEAMGYVQRRQGKWDEAVKNIERAVELDPKTTDRISNLVQALIYMRRYDDADRYVQRALESDPKSLSVQTLRAFVLVSRDGDAQKARDILVNATPKVGQVWELVAQCDICLRDYDAVAVDMPSVRAYPGTDSVQYYSTRASAYYFAGRHDAMRAYADSARAVLEARHAPTSGNAQLLAGYGSTLALLGRYDEALRYVNQAVEMLPVEKDALSGVDMRNIRMILYIGIGDIERAIQELQFLMSVPSPVSPAILRVHPGYDAIRDDPRFKKLAEEKVSS